MSNPIPSALALAVINDGDLITASPHRSNYSAIQAAVNKVITALSGGTAGQVLQAADGTDVQWANSVTSYHSEFDIVNLATEQTVFTQSIPGNTIGIHGALLIFLEGDYLNSSGSSKTLTVKVTFGGTTVWGSISGTFTTGANHVPIMLHGLLANEGAANVQRFAGRIAAGAASSGSVAGLGTWASTSDQFAGTIGGSAAVDTTAAQTLAITVTHSAASASTEVKGSVHVLLIP